MTNLTRQQNIFLAKKTFVENIYHSAYLEGCNLTYPQTKALLDGMQVSNIALRDIQIVINLRDAWRYLLDTLDEPLTLSFICTLNSHISRNESVDWGVLRYGSVGVTGTDWIPPIPQADAVSARIQEILTIPDPIERACEYYCFAVKSQLFWDGNKRTSLLVMNKILIEAGCGLISIPSSEAETFNTAISHYYNTDDSTSLKEVLRYCIYSTHFRRNKDDKN